MPQLAPQPRTTRTQTTRTGTKTRTTKRAPPPTRGIFGGGGGGGDRRGRRPCRRPPLAPAPPALARAWAGASGAQPPPRHGPRRARPDERRGTRRGWKPEGTGVGRPRPVRCGRVVPRAAARGTSPRAPTAATPRRCPCRPVPLRRSPGNRVHYRRRGEMTNKIKTKKRERKKNLMK